jgi:hypothetical protein
VGFTTEVGGWVVPGEEVVVEGEGVVVIGAPVTDETDPDWSPQPINEATPTRTAANDPTTPAPRMKRECSLVTAASIAPSGTCAGKVIA